MKLLLDTHTFLWMDSDRDRLLTSALEILDDRVHEVWFSAVSSWEISVKRSKGKLQISGSPMAAAKRIGFPELAITAEHAEAAGELPLHHRDPFDRMLIAQARVEGLVLATRNTAITRYGIAILPV